MLETISNLTAGGVALWVAICVAFVMTFIQITPIKVNPWSWIARKIGRAVNGELMEEVQILKVDLTEMKDSNDERDARQALTRVLRFGDECRHGVKHSKEHFDEILRDVKNYYNYCDTHPDFKNERMEITAQLVRERYKQCLEEDNFI